MGRGHQLTDREKGQIDGLKKSGSYSNRQIAAIIGRSANVINNYLKDPEEYGTKTSPGRPKVLSDRDSRRLFREISNTCHSIPRIKSDLELPGCRTTIWNALRDCPNIEYTKGQTKPDLKPRHIDARLKFAEEHIL